MSTKNFSPFGPAVWADVGNIYMNVLFYYIDIYIGCIGGGYTDIPWSRPVGKGRYVSSDKSFLFSLHNPGRSPAKFEIKKKLFAVSHHPECGPVFGAGADLFICDGCDQQADSYSNLPHSYDGQVVLKTPPPPNHKPHYI